jgi:hypothetical protein
MRHTILALLLLTVLPVVASAQPGVAAVADCLPPAPSERYYVTLFGGQGDVFRPRTAHTWATFVRTAVTPAGERVVGEDTISWLPATLNVRPWAVFSEPGVNLTLQQTFDFMGSYRRQRVAVWGPYEITAERYAQAMGQKALLESGAVRYHALGLFGRKADVMHCIDGVTRTDPAWERKADPSRWFGEAGTAQATRAAVRSGFILNPTVTHDWIVRAVNPTGYKLTPRTLNGRPLLGVVR